MNFDRVASVYDAPRGLPDEVADRVADRVIAATDATADTRFLEMGVGTGRIALPFVERGFVYTGVDISRQMMDRLREKAGYRENLRLIEADVADLPFPDDSVDVVLTVHVLHLIEDWRAGLREAQRVLRPGGYFVEGHDWSPPGEPAQEIRRQWRSLVEEAGTQLPQREGMWKTVQAELTEQGWMTSVYRVACWKIELRPIELLELLRKRAFSASWEVPEEVLEAVHERMLAWARERYGDIERAIPSWFEFVVSVSTWPDGGNTPGKISQ